MKSTPDGLVDADVAAALRDGWSLDAVELRYAPLGAGSYHWHAADAAGRRWFVTVDDLAAKAWLGDTDDERFDGLHDAFATAAALHGAGLGLVVAPIRAHDGEPLRRLGGQWTIAVFPFVDGRTADWGRYDDERDRLAVAAALGGLHAAAIPPETRTTGLDLPGRRHIEEALRDVDSTWHGGPFSEPARAAVREATEDIAELLELADRLAADAAGGAHVVTHGEPHRANIVQTTDGPRLVDWDTVALAPPERDLWMLAASADDDAARLYADATGHRVDDAALDYFRLTWELKDLAEYLNILRGPHVENDDTRRELAGLVRCGSIRETWKAA